MALTEAQRAYQRAWAAKNRERVRESKRRYRERERLGLRAKGREYWRDPTVQERAKAKRRTPEGRAKRHEEYLRNKNKNPGARRNKFLFEKYGVTLEQYNTMLATQGGGCAICRQPPKAERGRGLCLEVDHNHTTGIVRGLLCRRCNTMVGYLEMDPETIRVATTYIGRYALCQP